MFQKKVKFPHLRLGRKNLPQIVLILTDISDLKKKYILLFMADVKNQQKNECNKRIYAFYIIHLLFF